MKKNMKTKVWMVLLILITAAGTVGAQTNFFTSSIFSNKVVFNPSQAGLGVDGGLRLNGVFRTPMNNSQPGLAKDYAATLDMAISETAGAGLVLSKQNVGLLNQTLFNFAYAYGTKLKSGMSVRMGFGAGFKSTRVQESNNNQIYGDQNDPALLAYNSAPPSFFSSFGLSVYTDKLEFQAVVPNLTASLQSKTLQTIDYIQAQVGLGYKLKVGGGKMLGPGSYAKIYGGMNMYKSSGSVINAGFLVSANDLLSMNFIYSTNGVMTVGVGVPIEKTAQINLNYSIGGLYASTIYGGSGVAEIHFVYLFKKKSK